MAEAGVEVVSKATEGVETLDGVGELILEAGEVDLEDLLGVLGALEDGCEAIAKGSHDGSLRAEAWGPVGVVVRERALGGGWLRE